jgi:hypothetical protein
MNCRSSLFYDAHSPHFFPATDITLQGGQSPDRAPSRWVLGTLQVVIVSTSGGTVVKLILLMSLISLPYCFCFGPYAVPQHRSRNSYLILMKK